jgi:hypothetical protein
LLMWALRIIPPKEEEEEGWREEGEGPRAAGATIAAAGSW